MVKKHIPMAIAYDFDGTLAPGNMQEGQFLPDIGIKPHEFWAEVTALTEKHQADSVLVYMDQMLRKAAAASVPVKKEDFEKQGESIKLFQGVEGWFDRTAEYGRSRGVHVEHYLVSSGNAEIVAGTPIASKFARIYASRFKFDENGVAAWPALAVNFTTKTQYLFRINKGAHDLSDNSKVNEFVEKRERPVPFENMVFIVDIYTCLTGKLLVPRCPASHLLSLLFGEGEMESGLELYPPVKSREEYEGDNYLEKLSRMLTAPIPPLHPELVAYSLHRYKFGGKPESTREFLLHAKEFAESQTSSVQGGS